MNLLKLVTVPKVALSVALLLVELNLVTFLQRLSEPFSDLDPFLMTKTGRCCHTKIWTTASSMPFRQSDGVNSRSDNSGLNVKLWTSFMRDSTGTISEWTESMMIVWSKAR